MMFLKYGKNPMELKETILENNLPDSFKALYQHKNMDNTMKSKFTSTEHNKTKYEAEVEYTRIDWFLPRIMFMLFKKAHCKHLDQWANDFKEYVETIN